MLVNQEGFQRKGHTVNPRERVLTALDHREPDQVPIDLAATTVSSIVFPAYQELRQYLGMEPDRSLTISHVHQGTVCPKEDLLQHYEVDFRTVYMKKSPRGTVAKEMADGSFYDENDILWKKMAYDYSPVEPPLADCAIEHLDRVTWPDPYDPERVRGLAEEARQLYENTGYAIVADIMCRGPFEQAVKLRGFEKFLMDLSIDPKFALALLEKITETVIGLWDVYLSAVGEYAQVVCQGDDMGMQTNLMFSPRTYRQLIKPCHKRIFDFVHSKTDAKVFMHSDGAIYNIIPDLIEIGVDILNPLQRDAKQMDIVNLKKEFGTELCFWGGGIDVQQILRTADLDTIREEVRRTIEVLAPGGGYVFALTHNIQPDITPERVDTAYATALKYRFYELHANL
jgi:uroporphyrinogen decarboxylase